jgi:hypothetical protein
MTAVQGHSDGLWLLQQPPVRALQASQCGLDLTTTCLAAFEDVSCRAVCAAVQGSGRGLVQAAGAA